MRTWLGWGLALAGGALLAARLMRRRGSAYQWLLRATGPLVARRVFARGGGG